MKQYILPRLTAISVVLFLSSAAIVISTTGCGHQKPGCGSKHQHKARAKKVKRMAPSMSM